MLHLIFYPKNFCLEFFHIYRRRHISYPFHDLYEGEREISQLKIFHDKYSLFGENFLFLCKKNLLFYLNLNIYIYLDKYKDIEIY